MATTSGMPVKLTIARCPPFLGKPYIGLSLSFTKIYILVSVTHFFQDEYNMSEAF